MQEALRVVSGLTPESVVVAPEPGPPATGAAGLADRAGSGFVRILEVTLALVFIGSVLLNFANVFGRYVLNSSMIGAEEVQTYVMVTITFLGAVIVAWRGCYLRMDVLLLAMPPRAQAVQSWIERIGLMACCGFVAVQSSLYAWKMYRLGVHSDGAEIPMWIPHGAVALGLALIALVALVRALQRLAGRRNDTALRVLV